MNYDENYFASHLGPIACTWDSPEWNNLFSLVANEIIERYNPKNIIDAGCGIGLLVKQFLKQSVPVLGFDSSSYAIHEVAHFNGLLHYCAPCALEFSNDLKWKAELVTCIEVVEHIEESLADDCIKNLCNMSKKYIVFSSSPSDTDEESHINVQPEKYWLNLFEKYGFEYLESATWICSHAFVLRKFKE